ncbi:MAG TPA: hypothetical protein VFR25_00850 [Candidatus Eisenbacteria bacterium]|nr:hypothetical protein [Candidatus Eisenbacteria bacterium]
METLTRLRRALLGAGLIVAAVLLRAVAIAAPFDARVIWTHGDRAYLVARDSVWVTAGSSLRFFDKKKEVASSVVVAIEDVALVVVRITSGSLSRVKHLDRLRVDAERPVARTALRVGIPSSRRIQPFFECQPRLSPRGFSADFFDGPFQGFSPHGMNLPDSLYLREFDDAADEEIALERGEIDAAIFWPGEASTHIREAMTWTGTPRLVRSTGVIGVRAKKPWSLRELSTGRLPKGAEEKLARLNADVFRGDLVPIHYANAESLAAWSFEVDPRLPGRELIQRALDPSAHLPSGTGTALLTYFDEPTHPGFGSDALPEPELWLFLIGCPVLSRPELRPYLESIDLSAIVNGFHCDIRVQKP